MRASQSATGAMDVSILRLGAGEPHEQDLSAERDRLILAASASGAGVWDYDIDADRLHCDARWYEIMGLDPRLPIASIAEFKPYIHPDDVERATEVTATFAELTANHQNYHITFRIIPPTGEVRWVRSAACLIEGDAHKPNRAVGAIFDITEQVNAETARAQSEQLLRALANTLPQIIFSAAADGTNDYLNERWREYTGFEGAIDDEAWKSFLHPEDRDRVLSVWRGALESGDRFQSEYRYLHRSGEYRWSRSEAAPLRDQEGKVQRWFGSMTDIHETKVLQIERELVARELDHRVKNMFALVESLLSLSTRDDPGMSVYAERMQKRLAALALAHNLIWSADRRDPSTLRTLLTLLLQPYENFAAPRISISGDEVDLDPAKVTPMALVFHELATNAAKYGALRTPAGRLHVRIRREAEVVRILWVEGNVAPAAGGQGTGFGSTLFNLIVERQMRGQFLRRIGTGSVAIRMTLPLSSLYSGSQKARPC